MSKGVDQVFAILDRAVRHPVGVVVVVMAIATGSSLFESYMTTGHIKASIETVRGEVAELKHLKETVDRHEGRLTKVEGQVDNLSQLKTDVAVINVRTEALQRMLGELRDDLRDERQRNNNGR